MKIGIAGPVSLRQLRGLEGGQELPLGYEHPPMSALVNSLLDRNFQVTVFTTSSGLDRPLILTAPALTVCVGRREPRAARDLFRSERRDLVSLMKNYPTDVINAHWSYEFAWAALDSGVPTIVTLRDHAPTVFRYRLNSYKFLRLIMNYHVLNRALHLSTNSEYLFGRLSRRHQRKARVINNFFADELSTLHSDYREREDLIVTISNGFGRLKNLKASIKAFNSARHSLPYLRYMLLGEGMGPGGTAEQYARRAGFADGIEFCGRLPHEKVLALLRKAKLLVHPSLEESFGMSVLEAMVIGTPVIAGIESGNIPHLLDDGRAGRLCNVRDPSQIARAVVDLIQNGEAARQLANRASLRANSDYSEEQVVSQYLAYYRDVIEQDCQRSS